MDGLTDIRGEEQETMFIQSARNGLVKTFLKIISTKSTTSDHLCELVRNVFEETVLEVELQKGRFFFVL